MENKPKKVFLFTNVDGFDEAKLQDIATTLADVLSDAYGEKVRIIIGPGKIQPAHIADFKTMLEAVES